MRVVGEKKYENKDSRKSRCWGTQLIEVGYSDLKEQLFVDK